jgi:hypothetical protein
MLNSFHMQDHAPSEAPPFLRRWRNVYALVLAALAFDIALLYAFTKAFA